MSKAGDEFTGDTFEDMFPNATIMRITPGRSVVCDFCGDDYTESKDEGGILFVSKAACPKCAPRIEEGAVKYGEQGHIRARCPAGMLFADWVRDELRGK